MDRIYIINDSITKNPEVYSDFYEAKERFLENIRNAAKNIFSDGEIPWLIRADLDGLDNGDIERSIDDVGLASYAVEEQEFILYEREVKHPQ